MNRKAIKLFVLMITIIKTIKADEFDSNSTEVSSDIVTETPFYRTTSTIVSFN
jgi:hypothetical protein